MTTPTQWTDEERYPRGPFKWCPGTTGDCSWEYESPIIPGVIATCRRCSQRIIFLSDGEYSSHWYYYYPEHEPQVSLKRLKRLLTDLGVLENDAEVVDGGA